MNPSKKKAERLLQIEAMLLAHPEGLSQSEIARRLQVNRSTINRYIPDLPRHIYIDDLDGGKWKIDREVYLVNVRFNLHEALAIHLAARLLATRMDKQNPHAAAALRKLGISLERLAPQISEHVKQSANVVDDVTQFQDPRFIQILEKLALAWAEKKTVRIWHRYEKTNMVYEYLFSPYFIEPYAVGQTVHAIGKREDINALRTFKIERIERIEETKPARFYTIPETFNPHELLSQAWGIWYTEEDPQEVVLRFSKEVASRVKETKWHSSEKVTKLDDGRIHWQAKVAEPKEMLPWIRGWGHDVIIVAPDSLKEEVMMSTHQLAENYNLKTQSGDLDARLLQLWGKTVKKRDDIYHPALYHMLDVGYVAHWLLSSRASKRWQTVLAQALNVEAETLHEWLPYIIALHDIGKISVPHQIRNKKQWQRLQKAGFDFDPKSTQSNLYHTTVGRFYLNEIISDDWSDAWREVVLDMLNCHHGFYQLPTKSEKRAFKLLRESADWEQMRQRAMQILQSVFLQYMPDKWPEPINISAALTTLNGFAILCDWLGSDSEYFTPAFYLSSIADYLPKSRQKAFERVRDAGFFQPTTSDAPRSFQALFRFDNPRPLQKAIDAIPDSYLELPSLTIIEAPTGEGKTEAALALAHRIAAFSGTDEMYIALPTMATSDAMHKRFAKHLEERLGLSADLVRLVHGQDFLKEDDLTVEQPLSNGDDRKAHPSLAWFRPKKKALLAPFGVGTIDQAELSALNVKHGALRLIGLAGKVVILDEVHAYDAYMLTIVTRMIEWLSAIGSSIILLSATLPKTTRHQLASAYNDGVQLLETESEKDYPSLIVTNQTLSKPYIYYPDAYQQNRPIYLHTRNLTEKDWVGKAKWLLTLVKVGGCVCWITNTVERAQRIYETLQQFPESNEFDCTLIHARFPLADRLELERQVFEKYGPNSTNRQGIVIGTQVLEQSLDLDFDVMVSDLAPIDLMLQRAGRLHRHTRENRSTAHADPHFYICAEWDEGCNLSIGDDAFYTEYLLRKTWRTVRDLAQWTLPKDYRPMVETVYHDDTQLPDPSLQSAWDDLCKQRDMLEGHAKEYLINKPTPDDPFYRGKDITYHEDEEGDAWIVAQTRWGQKSITVIPLMRNDDTAQLVPTAETVLLTQKAPRATQLTILRRSVRITRKSLVRQLETQVVTEQLFTQSSLLKHCIPLWLESTEQSNRFVNHELAVALDTKLGIVISKKE